MKGPRVKLSELRGTFRPALDAAQRLLYGQTVQRGWFPADPHLVRARWAGVGVLAIVLGVAATVGLGIFYGAAAVGVAAIAAGLVILGAAGAMPRKTSAGRDLLWHLRGFRRYMETAETDRQRFAERENIFAEYLPYAIVFGSVTKWARAFSGLDAARAAQGWYVGPSVTNIPVFASELASFSSTISSTIVSTPGGSGGSGFGGSGFGGGGFSGGGGGGGGGGSW